MSSRGASWDADPERRKKVGQYVLGPCLGEGSFAKVRSASHIISREKVAVKIVSKRVIIRRDAARRNFRREALLLQHVCHPNIVRLFEAMETPNSYYLVFELAHNGHLLTYLTDRKCLAEGESRHFFRQIVSALDHLHQSGIVHRDLKLENCLLTRNWDVKITDFGLSALCQRESALSTQCGSPMYVAPEIFANRRYGPPVDLWSSGVCLYAMVVGRLPFVPDPPTNLPLLHAMILKGAAIPSFLSPGLQQLLSGLLEVQESKRLSVSDLLHQSWLTCNNNQPIARLPAIAKAPPPSVDTNVVRYMTAMFRFQESDVIHSVTERKLNASSATYHLLKRHMEGQERLEGEVNKARERAKEGESSGGRETTVEGEISMAEGEGSGVGEARTEGEIQKPESESCGDSTEGTLAAAEVSSGCHVLRSQILPNTNSNNNSNNNNASVSHNSEDDLGNSNHQQQHNNDSNNHGRISSANAKGNSRRKPSNYKECILYLKEARNGFSLGGKSLSSFYKDVVVDAVKVNPRHSGPFSRGGGGGGGGKLPLLNAQKHQQAHSANLPLGYHHEHPLGSSGVGHHLHSSSGVASHQLGHQHHHPLLGSGSHQLIGPYLNSSNSVVPASSQPHQCYADNGVRHYVHPVGVSLNVTGRPVLGPTGGGDTYGLTSPSTAARGRNDAAAVVRLSKWRSGGSYSDRRRSSSMAFMDSMGNNKVEKSERANNTNVHQDSFSSGAGHVTFSPSQALVMAAAATLRLPLPPAPPAPPNTAQGGARVDRNYYYHSTSPRLNLTVEPHHHQQPHDNAATTSSSSPVDQHLATPTSTSPARQDYGVSVSSPRSRSSQASSPRPESSLQDPFSRDTWRTAFKQHVGMADDNQGPVHRKPIAFVAPLSSPKALTSREETPTARKHGYLLLRQLTCGSDPSQHRNVSPTPRNKTTLLCRSMPPAIADHSDGSDDDGDDSDDYNDNGGNISRPSTSNHPFTESLTPVIRVTITSTAKH